MSKTELDNLVKIGQLKTEPASKAEFAGMLQSAQGRLADAKKKNLGSDSRFDLAYGAAHRLALAALRHHGYRPAHRFTVFQSLVHTLGTNPVDVRILDKAHNERNLAEYEGRTDIDEQLLADLIRCAEALEAAVARLPPLPDD